MNKFIKFRNRVNDRLVNMVAEAKLTNTSLFRVNLEKDVLWELYLAGFLPKDNPMFKERTEHDCQCCRQFINAIGNVVLIKEDYTIESIWDIEVDDKYRPSVEAMRNAVHSRDIVGKFYYYSTKIGTKDNYDTDGNLWEHFYTEVPSTYVKSGDKLAFALSLHKGNYNVLKNGLSLISSEACETIIELIQEKKLYRGEEFIDHVKEFRDIRKQILRLDTDLDPNIIQDKYVWLTSFRIGNKSRFKNTAIGTLAIDLTKGIELEDAVAMYESKVAPNNYKRTTALITSRMIKEAYQTVKDKGLEDSLKRRHAVVEDISINDVLYADRSVRSSMGAFDTLLNDVPEIVTMNDKIQKMNVDEFLSSVLPKADRLEILFDPNIESNLMTLTAPKIKGSKSLMDWNNGFSWAYKGDIADSMKERVKSAGGKVDGVLRFSIQWNENKYSDSCIDLDAHCNEPSSNHIYFGAKVNRRTKGNLDVDIIDPKNAIAVENITWPKLALMEYGVYTFKVHNYSTSKCNKGFTAEIEFDGKIFEYNYPQQIKGNEYITVAEVERDRVKGFSIKHALEHKKAVKNIWSIGTNKFHQVNMVMNSPNHWVNEKGKGNKHIFFIIDNCINPDSVRGFFNEQLNPQLIQHRKVFEILGSKTKIQASERQLSGFGFSSTKTNSVVVKVQLDKQSKLIEIIF